MIQVSGVTLNTETSQEESNWLTVIDSISVLGQALLAHNHVFLAVNLKPITYLVGVISGGVVHDDSVASTVDVDYFHESIISYPRLVVN